MVRNISFYNGGFQAKYGDKMSSVLDIQYKKPKRFGGSASVSYTHLRAHETVLDLVCRLLLEKKNQTTI